MRGIEAAIFNPSSPLGNVDKGRSRGLFTAVQLKAPPEMRAECYPGFCENCGRLLQHAPEPGLVDFGWALLAPQSSTVKTLEAILDEAVRDHPLGCENASAERATTH